MTETTEPATPAAPAKRATHPVLRLVLELGPLVVFFITNAKADVIPGVEEGDRIYWATGVFMVMIVISLVLSWKIERRLPVMPLVTAVFVLVFGGLTLALQNETFIKLKPTIVNVLFSAILFGGLAFGRSLLQPVLGAALPLTDRGWRILTWRWAFFFLFLAAVNELVWRGTRWYYMAPERLGPEEGALRATDIWVSFKVFGIMPLTFIFMMCQIGLLNRESAAEPEAEAE